MKTKIHPGVLVALGLVLVLVAVIGLQVWQEERVKAAELAEKEAMAKQRNDQVIADTAWPDNFTGSRQDSFRFAKEQDREDAVIVATAWPGNQVFTDREDSLRFAIEQDEEAERIEEERVRKEREMKARIASFTWSTTEFVNEWGETSTGGAQSKMHGPVIPMSFPYGDVEAVVFVQCRPRATWIRFTSSPNLTNDDTKDGYNEIYLRVRLDGNQTRWRATQKWGGHDLNLPRSAINAFKSAKTFEVIIPWYGQGNVRFEWDLTGSSEMITRACG